MEVDPGNLPPDGSSFLFKLLCLSFGDGAGAGLQRGDLLLDLLGVLHLKFDDIRKPAKLDPEIRRSRNCRDQSCWVLSKNENQF